MCLLLRDALQFTALFLMDNRAIILHNKENDTWMFRTMKLFLVFNRMSRSFALLTREISWSTLKINLIFPHIHVLSSLYIIAYYIWIWLTTEYFYR